MHGPWGLAKSAGKANARSRMKPRLSGPPLTTVYVTWLAQCLAHSKHSKNTRLSKGRGRCLRAVILF